MNWTWDTSRWKRSTKILLGIATIWPVVYMCLFVLTIFSFVLLLPFAERSSSETSHDIDLIQLEKKINGGELKQLTVKQDEIVAIDRQGGKYRVYVTNENTRTQILKESRELNADGRPRVPEVEEETSRVVSPFFPISFVGLFAVHIVTIFLIMGLMALYIVLVVKTDRVDQTMKILWAVLICLAGMFAMPIFWYLYIWRDALPTGTVATAS